MNYSNCFIENGVGSVSLVALLDEVPVEKKKTNTLHLNQSDPLLELEFYSEVMEILRLFRCDLTDSEWTRAEAKIQTLEACHKASLLTPDFFRPLQNEFIQAVRSGDEMIIFEFLKRSLFSSES